MTYNKAIIPAAETGEEAFAQREVFFSRTDKLGVIKSGNEVFRRMSGYDWAALSGATLKILRHPETPDAVYWLLWKTIQTENKTMVAYLRNRSASGRWFWTLAVVVPFHDGYISIWIKPSGALFAVIKALYAEVAAAEVTLAPDKAADLILGRLADLGFPSYADFSAQALEQELSAREAALGITNPNEVRFLAAMATSLTAMASKQADLLHEFDALQSIPTNMRIIASRLEPSGGPISAISDNYKFASTEISRRLEGFAGNDGNLCQTIAETVRDGLYLSAIARLMSEVRGFLAKEDNSAAPVDFARERDLFAQIVAQYHQQARDALFRAEQVAGALNLTSGEIRRMMLGLDTIRVMGRVESGRLGAVGVGLSASVEQLDTRHSCIAGLLQGLMDQSAIIRSGINAYQRRMVG